MRHLRKLLAVGFLFIICISAIGCSGKSSNSNRATTKAYTYRTTEARDKILFESDAITAAEKYVNQNKSSYFVRFGFKSVYSPQFGSAKASKYGDGDWEVTLKGNISGYTDEYRTKFETVKFTAKVYVNPKTGRCTGSTLSKEY